MRELLKALSELENQLITTYGISLNEAMVLCSIGSETVAAGTIVERTGMTPSHTSKTISLIEKKEMVTRDLGKQDKRQMYFTLTDKAKACNIRCLLPKGNDEYCGQLLPRPAKVRRNRLHQADKSAAFSSGN